MGAIRQLLRPPSGISDRFAGQDQIADSLDFIRVAAFQQRSQQRPMLARRRPQEMDHRQRQLAFLNIAPQRLTHRFGVAKNVEQIVLNLKRRPDGHPIAFELFTDFRASAGQFRPEQTARRAERRGLSLDDLEIRFLVQIEIVPVVDLEQFALADAIGRRRDDAAPWRL